MSRQGRRLAAMVLLIAAGVRCSATSAPKVSALIGKVWMHVDGDWQRPPADADYPSNYRSAPVTLIRFTSDHEFSMMHCWIIEYGEKLTISNGDGQAIFLGTWTSDPAGIAAAFRLVYETVQPVGGGRYPGPEERATASRAGRRIRFRGKLFDDAKTLDGQNYEELIATERASGSAAERQRPR